MFYDTDGEETVQANAMFPIFDAPDTPLYKPENGKRALPGSFFDDLGGTAACVRQLQRPV